MTSPLRIGFALTGSFCTFGKVMPVIETLTARGCAVTPLLSYHAATLDTRFGDAAMWRAKLIELTGREPIDTITAAEPIGPKQLFDVLVVAPCTGLHPHENHFRVRSLLPVLYTPLPFSDNSLSYSP